MTTYRHRRQGSGGAVLALGALFVLAAAAVLYGAYRWVNRVDATPETPVAEDGGVGLVRAETPFDNALIDADSGAFVMVVEVPVRPDEAERERLRGAVAGCLSFEDAAGLYPEAKGRERIVRVLFHFQPTRELLEELPLARVQVWAYGPDQKPHPLPGIAADAAPPRRNPAPRPEPAPPTDERVTIDMVLENPDTGAVALVLIQEEPWTETVVRTVRRRVAGYVRAVESGALAERIDGGEKVEIHVNCRDAPGAAAHAALVRLRRSVESGGLGFRVFVLGAGGEQELDLDR